MYIIEVVKNGKEIVETKNTRSHAVSLDVIKRLRRQYPDFQVFCVWKSPMSVVADNLELSRKEN